MLQMPSFLKNQCKKCTVLLSTVLYSSLLYSTALHCTVLYCTVLHSTVLHCTVVYCTVNSFILHRNSLQQTSIYCSGLCCILMHISILYCTISCCTSLLCYKASEHYLSIASRTFPWLFCHDSWCTVPFLLSYIVFLPHDSALCLILDITS